MPSGMSHGAVGREFNVHELTIRYIQEEEICRFLLEAPLSAKIKSTVRDETTGSS